ncbi:MAG: hypothetical protein ABJF01_07455 [bacterium]
MRDIIDSTGIAWTVFEVKRGSGDQLSYAPEGFRDGWLCFESEISKRRLTPVPPRWREFSDDELVRLLPMAQPVTRPRTKWEQRREHEGRKPEF